MEMKHYVDKDGQVHGLWASGEQDHIKQADWVEIEDHQIQAFVDRKQQAEFDKNDYYRKRIYSYPELGEFVDAWVKGDEAALEEYKRKCLEVKAKYPKPAGF
jgi:hypothetical protein